MDGTRDALTRDAIPGDELTGDERDELHWLRAENTFLRVQLDILTRIATGYARDVDTILRLRAHS